MLLIGQDRCSRHFSGCEQQKTRHVSYHEVNVEFLKVSEILHQCLESVVLVAHLQGNRVMNSESIIQRIDFHPVQAHKGSKYILHLLTRKDHTCQLWECQFR